MAWPDESSAETAFKIERSLDGATGWAEIVTVGAGVESFDDTDREGSTQYFYRVRATNANGDSDYSNTANDTTDAPGVTGRVEAASVTVGTLIISP